MKTNAQAFEALFAKMASGKIAPPAVTNIAEIKRDNIVLEKYLRVGDLVVMHMDEESRHYRKDVPDGTIGIVEKFRRYKDHQPRVNQIGKEAEGVYEKNGVATIVWTDGTASEPGAGSLRWLTNHEEKQKQRREDRAGNAEYEKADYLGPLPETALWEMDVARIVTDRQPWRHTDTVRVRKIDYHRLGEKRSDGSPMPIYDVTPLEPGYGTCTLGADEIVLLERGNVWKWFNGQRDQVKFDSLEEEIQFHFMLGQEEQIKCEQSQGYHWPFSAILPALHEGTIDLIKRSGGFFGASDSMSAHKLTDPDLSQRVREESIRGYTQDAKLRVLSAKWDEFTRNFVIRRAIEFGHKFINVKHQGEYVDTTELELLGIEVEKFDPIDAVASDFPKGSYVFFSPKFGAFDIPHTSTLELDEEATRMSRAFKRNKDDHFEIRIHSENGWSEKARDVVIAACKAFGVPFADRANVADDVMKASGIGHIVVTEDGENMPLTFEIDGFVFFTHRGMKDLSYYATINIDK